MQREESRRVFQNDIQARLHSCLREHTWATALLRKGNLAHKRSRGEFDRHTNTGGKPESNLPPPQGWRFSKFIAYFVINKAWNKDQMPE